MVQCPKNSLHGRIVIYYLVEDITRTYVLCITLNIQLYNITYGFYKKQGGKVYLELRKSNNCLIY